MKPISAEQFHNIVSTDQLRSASIFGAISEDAIEFLITQSNRFEAQKGDHLFRYGDPGDSFYIIAKGSVDFYKHHEGKSRLTRTAEFGNELGFVSMIALHDRAGEAIAREESVVLEITSEVFSKLHAEYSFDFGIITLNLSRDMARTLRKLGNDLVVLANPKQSD